ncbi:MAG TPA: hypothetical protein VLA29_02465 [Acidimicrobiia bacterium]|nr:hypothetical protein [Acidimicrobiia bacterium]
MGLTFLTGYILGQHGRQSARLASSVAASGGASKIELLDVHDRVDRLILVVDAIWSLLEESGLTDEQLRERIEQIDAADGVSDGRRTVRASECRRCGAMVPGDLPACQFCGTPPLEGDEPHPLAGI